MLLSSQGCVAEYMPVGLRGPKIAGLLVIKVTKRIASGVLVDDPERLPIWHLPLERNGRTLPGDATYQKAGTDIIVVGDAYAPHGKPAPLSAVLIDIGAHSRRFAVFGDRVWKKGVLDFTPSEPAPFTRMPLDFQHAYGGTFRDDEGNELPHFDNPVGKGFILPNHPSASSFVAGTPLPNIEWADNLIKSWKDTPDPAGCEFYPTTWGMRLRAGVSSRGENKPPQISPALFNQAHPAFVLPSFPDGARCRISGMTERGALEFHLTRPALQIQIERPSAPLESVSVAWDTVCVLPEEQRVYMVARTRVLIDPDVEERSVLRIFPAEPGLLPA